MIGPQTSDVGRANTPGDNANAEWNLWGSSRRTAWSWAFPEDRPARARRLVVGQVSRHATGVTFVPPFGLGQPVHPVHGVGWGRTHRSKLDRLDWAFRIAHRKALDLVHESRASRR